MKAELQVIVVVADARGLRIIHSSTRLSVDFSVYNIIESAKIKLELVFN